MAVRDRVVVVTGATGRQGGAVARHLLTEGWRVRAVTRSPGSERARRLAAAASKLRGAGGYRVLAHVAWTQPPAAWNSRRGVPVGELGINVPGLSGNVILERGQYLHLGFDLKLEEEGRSLQLADLRRVKVDEAQYFDHPQLGIVALVTSENR